MDRNFARDVYEAIPAHAGIRVGATYNLTVAAPELAGFAGVAAVRHDANGHSYETVSTASAMTHLRASLGIRPGRARYSGATGDISNRSF